MILINSKFEKDSVLLLVIVLVIHVINYLFQIIMGKQLSLDEFGTMNALISIITILSVFSTIITMAISSYTAKYAALNEYGNLRAFVILALKLTTALAAFIFLAGIVLSKQINAALVLESEILVSLTFFVVVANLFCGIIFGVLQGLKNFTHYGITATLITMAKFFLSILAVKAGFGLYGIMIALLLGYLSAICYGLIQIANVFTDKSEQKSFELSKTDLFHYVNTILLIQICITIMMNCDILFVKRFFSPQEAGIYSSAMVIGKISYQIVTAIVIVLFPMVIEQEALGKNTRNLLYKSLLYTVGVSLCCAVGIAIFPEVTILLFGARYSAAVNLLFPAAAYIFPVTLLTILMNYQIAIKKTVALSLISVGTLISSGIVMCLFHSSMAKMLYAAAVTMSVGTLINFCYLILLYKDSPAPADRKKLFKNRWRR